MASSPIQVFDPRAVRRHRARALGPEPHALAAEAAQRLAERLDEVRRRFPVALDLGCGGGALRAALAGKGGIERLVSADSAPACAAAAPSPALAAEAEALPFAAGSFDLVASSLALHWVNDLPGALLQLRHALKPDGLLLANLWGGETLSELRQALLEAEAETVGGAGPRVSPFADGRDLGALLQRAGFALPVVDSDRMTVTYADALALMRDLRAMGEANAVIERRKGFSRRATLAAAAARYAALGGAGGRITATFELVTLTAWAPHESQPRPLRPGSAAHRLAAALDTDERPAGDKAAP
ncbi:MAG TPA: methyltransferase domain-containing protein [Stellaceae bacterium]|nr:methyltransferase domain-containing protein [Stellaceae bacterium]